MILSSKFGKFGGSLSKQSLVGLNYTPFLICHQVMATKRGEEKKKKKKTSASHS
jgi:hypothetical protein